MIAGRDDAPSKPRAAAIEAGIDDLLALNQKYTMDPLTKRSLVQVRTKALLKQIDDASGDAGVGRARLHYWRGKVLHADSEFSQKTEDLLSKAIKLDPSIVDAWNCLGQEVDTRSRSQPQHAKKSS